MQVREATGRDWQEWFAILDAAGVVYRAHGEIVDHLEREHPDLTSWWRQAVTVEYERARGKRAVGQTKSGFQVTVQRTFAGTPERAWRHLTSERDLWLDGGELRVSKPNERVRFTWQSARVLLTLLPGNSGKTQLHALVEKLPDADARETARAHWANVLDKLVAS